LPIDLAVRYGGDEFAVVLIDSDKGMAEQVAQRIETGLRSDPNEPAHSRKHRHWYLPV